MQNTALDNQGGDQIVAGSAANIPLTEGDLVPLNQFLQTTTCSLVDVNKDMFNQYLHKDYN